MDGIKVTRGFSETERAEAARLYWQAFGAKLGSTLGPADRGEAFFGRILDPAYALVARGADGRLLGLAGFKTGDGSMTDGRLRDMIAVYGLFGSLWRALLLSALSRSVQPGVLLMDGICVSAEARGRGIGTLLLHAIQAEAQQRGMTAVRLDVIDTNPKARALYEREGFMATGTESTGPLRHVFGFSTSTSMLYDCRNAAN